MKVRASKEHQAGAGGVRVHSPMIWTSPFFPPSLLTGRPWQDSLTLRKSIGASGFCVGVAHILGEALPARPPPPWPSPSRGGDCFREGFPPPPWKSGVSASRSPPLVRRSRTGTGRIKVGGKRGHPETTTCGGYPQESRKDQSIKGAPCSYRSRRRLRSLSRRRFEKKWAYHRKAYSEVSVHGDRIVLKPRVTRKNSRQSRPGARGVQDQRTCGGRRRCGEGFGNAYDFDKTKMTRIRSVDSLAKPTG